MCADSITQAFDRACRRADLEGLRFHDLCHEVTSRLFERGLTPHAGSGYHGAQDIADAETLYPLEC